MNARYGICAFLVLLLITAGCTQPAQPVTPAPTAVETATEVPATTATKFIPPTTEPIQSLPDVWGLEVQAYSNGEAINPLIIVTNRGGKGLNFINQLDIRVTRSDGIVEETNMTKPMYVGKTVELKSTTLTNDRVEVWAYTPENERVKIMDKIVCFRCYN